MSKPMHELLHSAYVKDHPRRGCDCSVDLVTGECLESKTRQEFAAECDVNVIMKQYEKLGTVSHVNPAPPRFGDFVDVPDFQEAQELFLAATNSFMALPSRLRADYNNDPAQFIAAVENGGEELHDRLRSLGLLDVPPPPPEAVVAVETAGAVKAPGPTSDAPAVAPGAPTQ